MSPGYEKPVRSATMVILEYIKEIRYMTSAGDTFYANYNSRLTPERRVEIEATLKAMESSIESYWKGKEMHKDDLDVEWNVSVLAGFIENMICEMSPGLLSRKYGSHESPENTERLERMRTELAEYSSKLRTLSLINDR